MAGFKNDPGYGQLFRNKYKKEDKHPDHRGSCTTPDGKEWEISAWIKEGAKGKFFSLSIQEPYKKEETKPVDPKDFDEDIPF